LVPGMSKECNSALDAILEARRSIRRFTSEIPPKELIEQIIKAGLWAPYSGLAVAGKDYRRFVVIPRESKVTAQLQELLKRKAMFLSEKMTKKMEQSSFAREHGQAFAERLKMTSRNGVPGLGFAAYYVVVAERKGIPAVEHRSLAHCLQNMWLKATALGLAFQVLSITAEMGEDKTFRDLLGIPQGQFALDGCLIGHPGTIPAQIKRPQVYEVTTWMS
jgi:nitroreductase